MSGLRKPGCALICENTNSSNLKSPRAFRALFVKAKEVINEIVVDVRGLVHYKTSIGNWLDIDNRESEEIPSDGYTRIFADKEIG